MKIGKKLIIGFMAIASLVGFVGIFSAISHNNIQTNSKIITEVIELDMLLDESLVKLLALIQAENVEDYIREKSGYEEIRTKFDALFKQLNNEYAKKLPDLGFNIKTFHEDTDELATISNRLIALHKRKLAKDKASEEKKSLENQLRHKIRAALFALQDDALTRDVELMQYKSQVALYKYKDQKHSIEWLESISKIKDNSLVVSLESTLNDLNAYERVAQDLSKIIVEQETIKTRKHLTFRKLQDLINLLEENNERIVNKIKAESQALARNTHLTMFVVIAGAFLVSIILGLTIARSISKPVANLAQTTQAIAQGDFSARVDIATSDEIGELAGSFNKMAEDLAQTTTSIDNLNAANQQLQASEHQLKAANQQLNANNQQLEASQQQLSAANQQLHAEITEREQMEDALRTAKMVAEAANKAKSQFLANMSHEIRTPMNAIIGFTDLLADEELTAEQSEYINIVRDSGHSLLSLINDILDLSRIEANQFDVDITRCSLGQLLNDVALLMKQKTSEKSLDYKIKLDDNLPAEICTDHHRLRQCLINLVGNAVKFTEQGHVYVNVSLQEVDDKPFIRFDVEDTGIGIAPDKQGMVFESFTQADGDTSRKYGGTGLGLAITKQLVELLSGELTLTSEVGKGSVFSLTIPTGVDVNGRTLLSGNMDDGLNVGEDSFRYSEFSGHILVAEDASTNQRLIKFLLERSGLQVTIAKDGNEALQKALTQHFDLIFMDIQMPNMNGYEATEALRREGVKTPIIALTANAMEGDKEKCIEAGCDDYLAKPIDRLVLTGKLHKYLQALVTR